MLYMVDLSKCLDLDVGLMLKSMGEVVMALNKLGMFLRSKFEHFVMKMCD